MKAYLHSISDAITNSSTEMFTILMKNAISIAKDQLQEVLDTVKCNKTVDEVFDVQATLKYWGEKDMVETVCTTDEELNKILDSFTESAPKCSLVVKSKETGMPLSILKPNTIIEEREFIC
jgi:mevalonate pyrophosphate decarboxylase